MRNSKYKKAPKFKYIHNGLAEEQIKEKYCSLGIKYVKGDYQIQKGIAQFKKWYFDNFVKNSSKS